MKQLVLILFCGTLIGSCTITKRHFGNGYHVEWNRKLKSVPEHEESPKAEQPQNKRIPGNIHPADSSIVQETACVEQPMAVSEKEQKESENRISCFHAENQLVEQQHDLSVSVVEKYPEFKTLEAKPRHDLEEEINRPRLHPLTWAIWGSWTAALISILIMLSGLIVSGIIGFAASLFIGMIFGIIVIAMLRKHPEKYRYKGLSYGFAIPAIIIGALVTFAAAGYILQAFVSF